MSILRTIVKIIAKPELDNFKGKFGEAKVNKKLNPLIVNKVYHKQINNIIIEDEFGKTHQIDHIEIRNNGIFCIETKNYIGLIYGDEKSRYWTQVLSNGQKNKFYSPIKQNNSHIYYLNKILNFKYHINSVIVFVKNNADKVNLPNVINLKDLRSYLESHQENTCYSNTEIDEIYNILLASASDISDKEHMNNVKKIEQNINNMICPRCGSQLVERVGKNGTFIGCSNFPNCRFTKNIE